MITCVGALPDHLFDANTGLFALLDHLRGGFGFLIQNGWSSTIALVSPRLAWNGPISTTLKTVA